MSDLKVQRWKLTRLREETEGAPSIRVNLRPSAVVFPFVRALYSCPFMSIRGSAAILASIAVNKRLRRRISCWLLRLPV
jgi:hypothetical protein